MIARNKNKKVIIVVGPTAVGKTAVAIELARNWETEIISADSRQCFRELDIGVARPSAKELAAIPHHFIASHSIHEHVDAAFFEEFALAKTMELFQRKDRVIMVGGTGLYIKAFCEGLDSIPEIDPLVRQQVSRNFTDKGLDWLQQEIKEKDPKFHSEGETKNPQRMMRALEVVESTGQSILSYRKKEKKEREFEIIKIGLQLPKEILRERIDKRVDGMIQAGLLEEVRNLLRYKHLNALHTVGYTEIVEFLEGRIDWATAIEQIKTNTRQYAKRQMTWFRKDNSITWHSPDELEKILKIGK